MAVSKHLREEAGMVMARAEVGLASMGRLTAEASRR